MSSFSSQQPVFLPIVDTASMFSPSEFEPNYPQFYYSSFRDTENRTNQEGCSGDGSTPQSSCVEQQVINIEKQGNDFSSMVDKPESRDQNDDRNEKKRKATHIGSSSFNSANSKGVEQVKPKKQKGDKEAMNEDKKGQNKESEEAPKGYIHVRARRGQATDSHSLAERVRREKISKKMGTLQALVPGCDKVTGKALMLDEIINYVQSLQNQVEFLSMKLASVDPMVYTFGLMDHDPIVFGAGLQGMNPLIESTGANTSGNTSPTQAFGPTNSCLASPATSTTLISPTLPIQPHVDLSTNLPQLEHKPNFFPFQDVGSSYWGINEQEQRQSIINQFGLSGGNNLYSLH